MASGYLGADGVAPQFASGELVRITRATKRREGGDHAVMWSLTGPPGPRENVGLFATGWDFPGLVLGTCAIHEDGVALLEVLFPHGVGYWWPECFERFSGRG